MNSNVDFQIECIDCGCLAIRIEDPVKASRESMVYCGDCGASRGSVGALRDLAVQPNKDDLFATTPMWPCGRPPAKASQSGAEISRRYDELCRLRRRVEIAESLARDAKRRLSGSERRRFSLRPSHHPDEGTLALDGAEIAMPDRA